MRLRRVQLEAYRSFVNQTLELDRAVTVLVGRNDSGKTSLLDRFFDQYVYENVIHSADRPRLPRQASPHIAYTLTWAIKPSDYLGRSALPSEFGEPGERQLEVRFLSGDGPIEHWRFLLDGRQLPIYLERTPEGWPVLDPRFAPRDLLPRPHYINIAAVPNSMFETRLFAVEPQSILPTRGHTEPERRLLRTTGLNGQTRAIQGVGIEEPWPRDHAERSHLSIDEIEERLHQGSERLTMALQQWWHDPPNLRFELRLAGGNKQRQHDLNTYLITWAILDGDGVRYSGTGLQWFLSFLVELLLVEQSGQPLLLLIDEPGAMLHPSAQRSVAKLLTSLAARHQVIYSTHSPFAIDWSFPQRLRLFLRDPESKRTVIENKPYAARSQARRIWDPFRDAVGVSLGDITVLGELNVLVEGVSDQILLANLSAALEALGRAHLPLEQVAIVPYNNDAGVLSQLLTSVRRLGADALVIADTDASGKKIIDWCLREHVKCLELGHYARPPDRDAAIEELVGITEYIGTVNSYYSGFEWFETIDHTAAIAAKGGQTLGAYLEGLFRSRFNRRFDKSGVAVAIADGAAALPETTLHRFEALVRDINERLRPVVVAVME